MNLRFLTNKISLKWNVTCKKYSLAKAFTHMWSNIFYMCLETIVMKPYFEILIVDIITVSKSIKRHSLIISPLTEFFFVNKIVFSLGRLYLVFNSFDLKSFFFIRSNVEMTVFFKTDFLPFLIFAKSSMKSSKKHSFPTYYFWYLWISLYYGLLKTGVRMHLHKSLEMKFLTSHSTRFYLSWR